MRVTQAQTDMTYLEGVSGGSIYRDVKLGDGDKMADSVWELGIGDQEGGDVALVQLCQDCVNLRVHDGLPHQREGTVPHLQDNTALSDTQCNAL